MNSTTCKNCGKSLAGHYCSHCGQQATVARIDLNYILAHVTSSILQIERGFFYTLTRLFLRPGKSINEFLAGKRQDYFKPLPLILVTSAIYFFAAQFFELTIFSQSMTSGLIEGLTNDDGTVSASFVGAIEWLANNHTPTLLLMLPLFSIASLICFTRTQHNYFEHLVINTYITGGQMLIYTVAGVALKASEFSETILVSLGLMFNLYCYYQVFVQYHPAVRLLASVLTYALFTFLILIALLFLTVLSAI